MGVLVSKGIYHSPRGREEGSVPVQDFLSRVLEVGQAPGVWRERERILSGIELLRPLAPKVRIKDGTAVAMALRT